MRQFKKGLAMLMSFALAASLIPAGNSDAAKKPTLSKTKLTLKVGDKKKLTIKKAAKNAKVTWKTSKKSVVKITKKKAKGKNAYASIKAVKKGNATITAAYKAGKVSKKLKCKVTVKKQSKNTNTGATANTNATPTPAGNNNTPTATPTPNVTATPAENTNSPAATPTATATATTAPTASPTPTAAPTPTPQPKVTLDLSGSVALNGEVTVQADGSVKAGTCDGIVIPLDKEYENGARIKVTIYGEASQEIRGWLESTTLDNGRVSEVYNPINFGSEIILEATAAGAKYIEIKKPAWDSPSFESITITKVEITDITERLDTNGWVTTWGTAEEKCDVTANAMPQIALEDSTVRQIIKVTTTGKKIRFRLSNQYGGSDVVIKSMHIAKQVNAKKSTIDTTTDTIITKDGKEEIVIPKGKVIVTDAIDFNVNALENIAISTYFGKTPTNNITGHRGARATTYQVSGNNVSTETFTSPKKTTSWFFLADCSLWSEAGGKSVVCFGDSITDGYGTDASYLGKSPDSYTRWGDYFAKRLQANEKTKNVAVINEGIGSNSIMGSYPTDAGKDRFARDLLQHDNVAYCIILFGVNDLNQLPNADKFNQLLPEYQKMIKLCRDNGIKVYGAPILPFGTSSYYSEGSEQVRQLINNWMRSSESQLDGIIDFESAVADPENPKNCLYKYTKDDGLHPYEGYEVMANAIDLKMFE